LALGPLVDRLSRRGLMIGADLARAGVFCALPFAPGAGTIVALAAVAGVATGFFRPAALAGVPNLVPEADLAQANSLLLGVETASWAAGPVVAGVLTAAYGPDASYWINAATFVLSALLIARIPRRLLQAAAAISKGHWRDLREGALLVRRSPALLTVLVAWGVGSIAIGIGNVSEVFIAKDTFSAGDFGYGLVYGSIGVGLVIGSLAGGVAVARLGLRTSYTAGIALLGTGFALAAASPNVWVGSAFFVVAGIGNGCAGICNALLVQRGAPDELRGRATTLVMSANFLALGAGMAMVGPLIDAFGARASTALTGGVFLLAAVVAAGLVRRVDEGSRPASERRPARGEVATQAESTGASL
jgi:MFS family permease